ncbi:MAG TPA: hypothetical protein VHS96_11340 [Bacteroidia bacterium]|nr:hypothetical protein [Bacteroidia bacterium]
MAKDEGKLANLLALLPEQDWERLRLFLNSPYFNRSAAVRALLEVHWETWANQADFPEDEKLFAGIFPNAAFDAVKLKNLRAALQRKLDDFFAQSAFEQDELLQHQMQLRKLSALAAHHYFPRYHQKALTVAESSFQDEQQRQLALMHFAELQEGASPQSQSRGQSPQASLSYHHAWQFFQLKTLMYLVWQYNAGAIMGQGADTHHAEAILPLIAVGQGALPAVRLYRQLLQVFQEPDESAHFQQLRQLLQAEAAGLAASDALSLYTGAINHCIRRVNRGEVAFLDTMLTLYKEMDQRGLLLVNGKLSAAQLKNMVMLAIRCQQLDWAEDWVGRYGKLLENDPHGTAEAFNQGMLQYARGDFEGAERWFHKVLIQFQDVFYGLDARSVLLQIYYETGNVVGMESLSESFKMFVKRNKRIAKAHKEGYLATARFFRKLIQIHPWEVDALKKLQAEIVATAFASSSKRWLLDKVGQLLARE